MQLTASSLLLSEGRGKIKSFPTRYWQWWSTQQALKCFFKHLINVDSLPSATTDVRDTAGKKSDVPALEEQITTTTKGERDSLKWAKEGCTNCVVCPGFPSVPGACQALSKFRTLAHTIPLAWNVLPLTPYTAGPFLSSPHFPRQALPNHPNQRGLILPSVTLLASVCFLQST